MALMPASIPAWIPSMAFASSVPPQSHPPMAQAPKTMGVASMSDVPICRSRIRRTLLVCHLGIRSSAMGGARPAGRGKNGIETGFGADAPTGFEGCGTGHGNDSTAKRQRPQQDAGFAGQDLTATAQDTATTTTGERQRPAQGGTAEEGHSGLRVNPKDEVAVACGTVGPALHVIV